KELLLRLCGMGYQFCVLDSRGEYLDFEPAVIFGTHDHAPDPIEILSALEKPDTQAVVCLEAVPVRKRAAFFDQFNLALHALGEGETLLWWRRRGAAPGIVTIARATPTARPLRADVGKLLRHG